MHGIHATIDILHWRWTKISCGVQPRLDTCCCYGQMPLSRPNWNQNCTQWCNACIERSPPLRSPQQCRSGRALPLDTILNSKNNVRAFLAPKHHFNIFAGKLNTNTHLAIEFAFKCQVWTSDLCSNRAHPITKVAYPSVICYGHFTFLDPVVHHFKGAYR